MMLKSIKSIGQAYDVPRHLYHFTPYTMQWLMKESRVKDRCCKAHVV